MANNRNSYTYKRYNRNKFISFIIQIILLFGVLVILQVYLAGVQKNASSLSITIILTITVLIAYSFIKSWDRMNRRDRKLNYLTWGRGAGAELSVQRTLEKLPAEYKTIADFNTGRGNIDFMIVGPKGIFIIECKANKGIISYRNEKLLCNGIEIEKDYIRQTYAEKQWLESKLKENLKHYYKVTGLLQFPLGKIDTITIHGELQGVWIGGYKFHEYLINKASESLSKEEVELIYIYLSDIKDKVSG